MSHFKNYLFAVLALMPLVSATAMIDNEKNTGNIIYVEDVISQPADVIQLEIIIDNSDEFVAFSFDLIYPADIMSFNPDPALTFLSDRAADHLYFASPKGDGVLFVFAFSPANTSFSGSSGSVMKIGFNVNAPDENNTYAISLFDAILSDENGQDILDEALGGSLFVVAEATDIPAVLMLDNNELSAGEVECFNATQSIITAGEDAFFTVMAGANVTLIAGENITMLPGTHIREGASLHAYIAPDGPFCGEADKHFLSVEDGVSTDGKNTETTDVKAIETLNKPSFKVYPNPANDYFTVELFGFEAGATGTLEVYNMQGALVMQRELKSNQEQVFDINEQKAGIYLVRLIQDEYIGVQRLIKR